MTEDDWLTCPNPMRMLEFIQRKASARKLRLLGCASCRHIWQLLTDDRSRQAVEVAERYADGDASCEELQFAEQAAQDAARSQPSGIGWFAAMAAKMVAAKRLPIQLILPRTPPVSEQSPKFTELQKQKCKLFLEVFGNPFRPVTVTPSWLTPTVLALADGIYSDRAFDHMPILADALQDAGCDNEDVLNHCRRPGEHVRGCWVVDLLLAKQ